MPRSGSPLGAARAESCTGFPAGSALGFGGGPIPGHRRICHGPSAPCRVSEESQVKRARLLPPSPGSMRVSLMTLAGVAMTLVMSAACTTGGSTQSAQPISTAYPSFGPPDGVGTCGAWRTLTPSQQAGILPWMYATLIQARFDVPKYPYPREKYLLKLTKSDVARGVAIIDERCRPYGDNEALPGVAFSDFPPSLPPGIYSPSPSPVASHTSAKPSSSATSP